MKLQKSALVTAMSVVIGITSFNAQAVAFQNGDVLTIDAGVVNTDAYGNTSINTGSFFGMDLNGDSKVQQGEKVALAQGTTGLTIGQTTGAGASHSGAPLPEDMGEITAPWLFYSNTGSDQLTIAATGDTTSGLDMSGWTVNWIDHVLDMGTGAWNVLNCSASHLDCVGATVVDGIADVSWSGVYGDSYTLYYTATIQSGGFTGTQYFLKLTGTVEEGLVPEVPVPATVWLFGSGLLGLVGVARGKKLV